MRRRSIHPFVLLLCLAAAAGSAQAQQKTVRLAGTNSPEVARARVLGRLAADEIVQFSITLPVRKQADLDDYLKRLYTPGDPLYRQYLLKDEFADFFGPTQQQYDDVAAFATRSGLKITNRYSNRLVLGVSGPAATVEKVFDVQMKHFQSPNGRVFHAPDREPAVPAEVASVIAGIADLDRSAPPVPSAIKGDPSPARVQTDSFPSGPNSGFAPADIKTAYNLNAVTQDGTAQTVGLLEFDGFYASDINAYADKFGLSRGTVSVITVETNSYPTAPTSTNPNPLGVAECTLDIDMVKALAPAAVINVYEGTTFVGVLNKIASDNTSQQISSSWMHATVEGSVASSTLNSENTAFQQMAAQGQSYFQCTGDYGDMVNTGTDSSNKPILSFGVSDPGAQPFVTAVGGTQLTVDGTNGAYKSETAWTGDTYPDGGSGGGFSTVWPLPSYQSLVVSTGSKGSSTARNLPDVSLNGAFATPYAIYLTSGYPSKSGAWANYGGTSAATPLWAGYAALVNQNRVGLNTGKLGFANPTIYFVARARLSSDFHDMTVGNNGTYPAVAGYDNVTGWGSFNGGALFNDLTRDATVFHVNANYTGSVANGGQTTPFKKITDALNAASATTPTLIYIRGAAYNEAFTTAKPLVLVNDGNGNATLGSSTVH